MENIRKVTIQDIARYTNISAGTIDRVIHNRGKVSEEKRQKIEDAIKKLNFNPNLLARTLALSNRFVIYVLIPAAESSRHYWSIPCEGIDQSIAMYSDYGLSVRYFFYNQFNEDSFIVQTNKILNLSPDGVVLAPKFIQESISFVKKLGEKGIPYVYIDADIPGYQSLAYIGPDIWRSAYIAGKLLNSAVNSSKEFLIVNMVKGFNNASTLLRMENGFKSYFVENGLIESVKIHNLTINSTKREAVFKELSKFYSENPGIKGVFVTNSKAFLVSEFHLSRNIKSKVIGFDLVEENKEHLKNGGIEYILSQSPIQQGARSIQTFFDFFIFKKIPPKVQYVPLDIIIKENLDFYLNFHQNYKSEEKRSGEGEL
ncbi:MAG: LacI family DNA-binding transcriptional regulator [Prolixibacteraceae bacterium]|nr:LacI family DNA-binding transcriptional regulator [Prolixibacteraceae bacterium]